MAPGECVIAIKKIAVMSDESEAEIRLALRQFGFEETHSLLPA